LSRQLKQIVKKPLTSCLHLCIYTRSVYTCLARGRDTTKAPVAPTRPGLSVPHLVCGARRKAVFANAIDSRRMAVGQDRVGDLDDKRKCRRRRVLREGRIVLKSGSSLINCIIRDQTASGAKLRVPAPTELPKNFGLVCLTDGMLFPAEIVWRRGDDMGVAFVGPPRRAPPRKW
jgi:two-component system cell cycle response regulator